MKSLISELDAIEQKALTIHAKCNTPANSESIKLLIEAADQAEIAHCGSWIGYHACVYYEDLGRPPTGAFFDRQWGLNDRFSNGTVGDWVRYNHADVFDVLKATKTKPSLDELTKYLQDVPGELDEIRKELVSIIGACRSVGPDDQLDTLKEEASNTRMIAPDRFVKQCAPSGTFMSHDQEAIAGGMMVPPHVSFRANVQSIRSLFNCAESLAKTAKRTVSYLHRREAAKNMLTVDKSHQRVFIGHGHSNAWLELKNYIQDRLHIPCDDFNREATAGKTTVDRLSQMLDGACFAFLVLTAEDERKGGQKTARMNVIHEVGLFQGRLGFNRAIVMLERGCEEFSNIHGLTHIPFDKGAISAAFYEVSDTLKRENVVA
jgi:predicted nucleotide-binding protein